MHHLCRASGNTSAIALPVTQKKKQVNQPEDISNKICMKPDMSNEMTVRCNKLEILTNGLTLIS